MELLSPSDLIKAADLATSAGDYALALQLLKTALAAAKSGTYAVVDLAPSGAVKPIEEPGVVRPLTFDSPNNRRCSLGEMYLTVCRLLRNEHLGYRFTFSGIAATLQLDALLPLGEDRYSHVGGRTIWKLTLSSCLKKLRKQKIICKTNDGTEYVLQRYP